MNQKSLMMLIRLREYIELVEKKLAWDGSPKIGWWEDQQVLRLYHGTNIKNVDSVMKNGLNRKDPDTGMISLALEPNTAYGYASMSGSGGESAFRKAGTKVVHTPGHERAIFVLDIPMSWIKQHYDPNLSGNIGQARDHMKSKQKYVEWMKKYDDDQSYYAIAELRVKEAVPAKFIKGYMIK